MSSEEKIPWAKPTLYGNEEDMVLDALRSTWISGGPYVTRLETEIARRMRARHTIAVSNGTTAIELALRGLGLKPGDEVIVPAFTFVAAANMILALGLRPLYADIDPQTWLLDPAEIGRLATPKTKAVIPVHLYGNVADMDAICAAAAITGLDVVEDTAEAAFSRHRGRYAGTIGRIGTFSFHATKTITTGEGGMVVTQDDAISTRCRLLRDHGMRKNLKYWHDVVGHNFRLPNMQAAIGCAQLENLDVIIAERRRMHEDYREHLGSLANIRLQHFDDTVDAVVWTTVVFLDGPDDCDALRVRRDRIMAGIASDGIETRPGFYDLNQLPPYDCPARPIAQRISAGTISFPAFIGLGTDDIDRICQSFRKQLDVYG